MKEYKFAVLLTHPTTKEQHQSEITIKANNYPDAKAIIAHYGITHWVRIEDAAKTKH